MVERSLSASLSLSAASLTVSSPSGSSLDFPSSLTSVLASSEVASAFLTSVFSLSGSSDSGS